MSNTETTIQATRTRAAFVVAAAMFLVSCGSQDDNANEPTTETPTTEATTASSTTTEPPSTTVQAEPTSSSGEESDEVVEVSEAQSLVSSPTRLTALRQPVTFAPEEAVNTNQADRLLQLTNSAGNFEASVEWPVGVANPEALDPGFVLDPLPVPDDIDGWLAQLTVTVEATGTAQLFGQNVTWWQIVIDEPAALERVDAPIVALWASSDEPATPDSTRVDRQIGPGTSLTFAVVPGDQPIIVSSEFPAAFDWVTVILDDAALN